MWYHYVVGVGAFVFLSVAWLGVQRAWRRSFSAVVEDPDALAGRPGCFGCARAATCARDSGTNPCFVEEELQ